MPQAAEPYIFPRHTAFHSVSSGEDRNEVLWCERCKAVVDSEEHVQTPVDADEGTPETVVSDHGQSDI